MGTGNRYTNATVLAFKLLNLGIAPFHYAMVLGEVSNLFKPKAGSRLTRKPACNIVLQASIGLHRER